MFTTMGDLPGGPADPMRSESSEAEAKLRGLKKEPTATEAVARQIQRRRALLIGIASYQSDDSFSQLRYPVNDVRAMRELLIGYNYSPVECIDDNVADPQMQPLRENILLAISRICKEAEPDDLLWIHFSCHGMRWTDPSGRDVRLLVAQDTRLSDPLGTAISVEDQLLAVLRASKARQKVVTLDACQLGFGSTRDVESESSDIAYDVAEGMAVLTASTSKQYAQESKTAQLGVFTHFLLRVLRDQVAQKRYAALAETARSVLAEVINWYKSNNRLPQQPMVSFEGLGELLLVDNRGHDPSPPLDDPNQSGPISRIELAIQIPDYVLKDELGRTSCSVNRLAWGKHADGQAGAFAVITLMNREFSSGARYHDDRTLFGIGLASFEKLQHPGFARYRGRGTVADAKRIYYVTEFLSGTRLEDALESSKFSYPRVLASCHFLASALLDAHANGLVHGDLSPHKIVVSPQGWKIIDLPVAALDVRRRLTEDPGEPRPRHWPPELTPQHPQPTYAADVFALGQMIADLLSRPDPEGGKPLHRQAPRRLLQLLDRMRAQQADQRPTMEEVVKELGELTPKGPVPPPSRRVWMLAGAGLTAAATLAAWRALPHLPPPAQRDLGAAADRRDKPLDPRLEKRRLLDRRSREVLRGAIADRGHEDLAQDAVLGVGSLRDPSFSDALIARLQDTASASALRKDAARALGRSGATAAIAPLRTLVRDPGIEIALWREALQALCMLTSPDSVLNRDIGRALLTDSPNPERRQLAAELFAASDKQAQSLLVKLASANREMMSSARKAAQSFEQVLGLARSLHRPAHDALIKLLAFTVAPSEDQFLLALVLAGAGDAEAVPVLRAFVDSSSAARAPADLLREARRLLVRMSPTEAQCTEAAAALKRPPGTEDADEVREAFYLQVSALPLCKNAALHLDALAAFLPLDSADFVNDRKLAVHAATAVLEILRGPVSQHRAASRDVRDHVLRHIESSNLIALHFVHLAAATDSSASSAVRRQAARQLRLDRAALAQRSEEPEVAAHVAKAEIQGKERQLEELHRSADPSERIVAVLAQQDEKRVESWMAEEKQPTVQLAIAERMHTPRANAILKQAAAGQGVAALRAYGELQRRGEPVDPPSGDVLVEYVSADPEKRLEIVEALSGWPFAKSRPVLLLASSDGSVEVRRSAVRIIGEAATDPQGTNDALSVLRLMFGDPDYVVHLYIRAILDMREVAPSELPDAAPWPALPGPEPLKGCKVMLRADDRGVWIEFDGERTELPTEVQKPPGTYALSYQDDQGKLKSVSVRCAGSGSVPLVLPISSLGQHLGRGIKLWESRQYAESHKVFDEVSARFNALRLSDWAARGRAESVRARSEYYLGKLFLLEGKLPTAGNYLDSFLQRSAAARYPELARDAKAETDRLLDTLGKFSVRVPNKGNCELRTAWEKPGVHSFLIRVEGSAPKSFPDVRIRKGVTTPGKDECP